MYAKNGGASGFPYIGMVPREGLVKKMKSISSHLFLSAPGGYGKTVAAMQWLYSVRGKTAKITAADADNDPGVFYGRLAAALLKLTGKGKNIPGTVISLDRLLGLIRLLPEKSVRRHFVLDDLHMINNQEIIGCLAHIVARLPCYIRLCLISRSEPPAGLMKTGLFEAITQEDFLFSSKEVEWLSIERDRVLSLEQIDELLETTGGWAMYISALLSGGKTKKHKIPKSLIQYLEARIWQLWDQETKNLILKLAVPAEIRPELAERLTGNQDGRALLERLSKRENAFISLTDADTYRFHDIFRDFLLERMGGFLSQEEIRRLHDAAAEWYYQEGDYYAGAKHYIYNGDHEGITRCFKATNRFHEETSGMSVEVRLNFVQRYVMNLSGEFIAGNPFIASKCAVAAYHNGETEVFLRYMDLLHAKMPEIEAKHPELIENLLFICSLDFRVPLKQCAARVEEKMRARGWTGGGSEARAVTITQNLPFFHRSMRDYSAEFHELKEEDLALLGRTFGAMVGKNYEVMGPLVVGGIYFEKGEMLEAAHQALAAYRACREGMHPESFFASYMLLARVLYFMGSVPAANEIMERMKNFIEARAIFLKPNFMALQTEMALRAGDAEAAHEWLDIYAACSGRLPFYQMCRHFTTLRSYIALENYARAIAFGRQLKTLANEYRRPIDQIESGLLTAVALWKDDEKRKAARLFEEALGLAAPYGFTRLFINEGKELLPLIWNLRGKTGHPQFVDRLIQAIYKNHDLKPAREIPPELTAQQASMLAYLSMGLTYNEIADAAGIGRSTVKYHVLQMYKRLGVREAGEAIVKAKMLGLMD